MLKCIDVRHKVSHILHSYFIADRTQDNPREVTRSVSRASVEEATVNQGITVTNDR
jgi:hypothetical protein